MNPKRVVTLAWLSGLMIAVLALPALAAPSPESAAIRRFLEGLDAGDLPATAGRNLNEPQLLAAFYRAREHAPVWIADGSLQREVPNVITAISQSVAHGFTAERYHRSTIETLVSAMDVPSRVSLELLLTDAFLSQALHRGRGAVFPPNLDAEWQLPPAEVDAAALLAETAGRRTPVLRTLDALWPVDPEYRLLVARRAEIVATGDETTVQIAPGPLLKPGQANDRVLLLKERLMGPGEHTPLYDDDLLREVKAFQLAVGLEPDGIVGDNTLEILNATRVSWIDRIDANLERWRWLPRETPETYIRVNIAAFSLRVMEQGREILSMRVIVGQPFRRTPVFTETLKYFVLNPYWNVPYSIATKDKLPLLRANAAAEAAKGFEAKPSGSDRFLPVDVIDWSDVTVRGFNYHLRQKPGPQNALGRLKFMMPNPNSIYLHDTPTRELFDRIERSFSSGCIRLEQPVALAEWLLEHDRSPEAGKVDTLLAASTNQAIYLKRPVPVYLVYFTAFALDDGDIAFRRDIYGRDRVIINALRAAQ